MLHFVSLSCSSVVKSFDLPFSPKSHVLLPAYQFTKYIAFMGRNVLVLYAVQFATPFLVRRLVLYSPIEAHAHCLASVPYSAWLKGC